MPFFRHQATCLAHNNEARPRRDPPRFQQLRPSQLPKSHRRQPWNPIEEFSQPHQETPSDILCSLLPYPILTQGGFTTLPDNSTTPRPYFLSRNVHEVTLDTVPITTSWSRTDFYPVVYFSLRLLRKITKLLSTWLRRALPLRLLLLTLRRLTTGRENKAS
jgi:hypothetical protein